VENYNNYFLYLHNIKMLGSLSKTFNQGRKFLGKSVNTALAGTKWLGKNIDNSQHMWDVGKQFVRNVSSQADKALGTGNLVQQLGDAGIQGTANNPFSKALSGGLGEVKYLNRRVQSNLQNPLLTKFINS
jgi:hypothetical protein